MPSRGSAEETAVTSTTLSPWETKAAPGACLAIRPVSKFSRLPPARSTETSCFMESSFSVQRRRWFYSRQEGTQHPSTDFDAGYLCARDLLSAVAASGSMRERRAALVLEDRGRKSTSLSLEACSRKARLVQALLTNAELADYVAVANRVVGLQVIQKATTLAHQHQQATPGCVVLLVQLE